MGFDPPAGKAQDTAGELTSWDGQASTGRFGHRQTDRVGFDPPACRAKGTAGEPTSWDLQESTGGFGSR